MRLCNEAHSYKTQEIAVQYLMRSLSLVGRTLEDTRWLIAVRYDGRFVPTVVPKSTELTVFLPLIHKNISVVGG